MVYATRPLFFLAFLGTAIGYRWPAAILGLLILCTVVLAFRSRFDRANPPAFYFTLWVFITACLVAWVRGAAGFSIASRYSLYSLLMLIFCYGFLADFLPGRWPAFPRKAFYVIAAVVAACLCGAADVHAWKKLGLRRQMVVTGIEQYRARPDVNSPMIDPKVEYGVPLEKPYEQRILTEAIGQGVYVLPPKP